MKLFVWPYLVAASLALVGQMLSAETRPQYGGTLRVEIREEINSLDPADISHVDSLARQNVLGLIFETLVTLDQHGQIHAALATRWQAQPGNQRWQFEIRRGVRFHDGSELTPEIAASDLRAENPAWKVFAQGDSVIVECPQPDPDLPAELALTRNGIAKKNGAGAINGTGPFYVRDWEPGKRLILDAQDNHWLGRAFMDSIEVQQGKNFHEQLLDLDSGKADLVEVAPEQAQRASAAGHRINSSHLVELVALVFGREAQNADEKTMRVALAHSIDRSSMRGALLQGTGEPAACLLPNWMTGYGFAFSTDTNLNWARQQREQVRTAASWTVGYDANDSLSHMVAERIALNAHDAGIILRPTDAANVDLRVIRISVASSNPWVALSNIAAVSGMTMPARSTDSAEQLYSSEKQLLNDGRVIPLFHLPAQFAVSPDMRDWSVGADGRWRLENVWVGKDRNRP